MNKLNNKGITLVELIISISLISIVMLFMYRLIADVSFDKDSEYFASSNQEQRVEIISAIETYILENNVSSVSVSDNKNISLGDKTISVTESNSIYTISFNGKKWNLKKGYSIGDASCINEGNIYECTIPIYTKNENNVKDNNNTIDDIIFSFILSEEQLLR